MPRMEGRVWKKVDYTVAILQSKLTIQKDEDNKGEREEFIFHVALARKSHHLAPVVQTLDSAIHRINHYPGDSVIDFRNTYPLDSAIQRLNNTGAWLTNLRATVPSSSPPVRLTTFDGY